MALLVLSLFQTWKKKLLFSGSKPPHQRLDQNKTHDFTPDTAALMFCLGRCDFKIKTELYFKSG